MSSFTLSMTEISQERFRELNKMARFLQSRGAATIEERGTWEGGNIQQIIHVQGEPVAMLAFTPSKSYYGEHFANFPPGPLTWGEL